MTPKFNYNKFENSFELLMILIPIMLLSILLKIF